MVNYKITRNFTYYTTCLSELLYDFPTEINNDRDRLNFHNTSKGNHTEMTLRLGSQIFYRHIGNYPASSHDLFKILNKRQDKADDA